MWQGEARWNKAKSKRQLIPGLQRERRVLYSSHFTDSTSYYLLLFATLSHCHTATLQHDNTLQIFCYNLWGVCPVGGIAAWLCSWRSICWLLVASWCWWRWKDTAIYYVYPVDAALGNCCACFRHGTAAVALCAVRVVITVVASALLQNIALQMMAMLQVYWLLLLLQALCCTVVSMRKYCGGSRLREDAGNKKITYYVHLALPCLLAPTKIAGLRAK